MQARKKAAHGFVPFSSQKTIRTTSTAQYLIAFLVLLLLLLVDLVGLKMVFIYPSPGVLYRNGSSNSSSKGKELEYAWVSFSALNPYGFLPISDVRRLISLEYTSRPLGVPRNATGELLPKQPKTRGRMA